jgi:hypothetical protein
VSFAAAYAGCVRCTLWSLAHAPSGAWLPPADLPRVYLVSDDPRTVELGALLPPGVLSSPLLEEEAVRAPLFHLDLPSSLGLPVGAPATPADPEGGRDGPEGGDADAVAGATAPAAAPGVTGVAAAGMGAAGADAAAATAATGAGNASAPPRPPAAPRGLPGLSVLPWSSRAPGAVPGLVPVPLLAPPASAGPVRPDVLAGFLNVFVELVALSACDVVVHTKSGFSKAAVEWGGLPVGAVRALPRAGFGTAPLEVQPQCGRAVHLPQYYRMAW